MSDRLMVTDAEAAEWRKFTTPPYSMDISGPLRALLADRERLWNALQACMGADPGGWTEEERNMRKEAGREA